MEVVDFLPKYPNIKKSPYDRLNTSTDDFYKTIYSKKEFYDNKLDKIVVFPKERGLLTKHQKTIAAYMSSNTPYDRLLLVHSMGSGKTCSAIGAIEQIKRENSTITGAIILAKGEPILNNFQKELVEKCTAGQYVPSNYSKLNELERIRRINKKTQYYRMITFHRFADTLKKMSNRNIVQSYSNKIIVIDEVHNLRIQNDKEEDALEKYNQFHRFLHLIQNSKVLFLSGTPMKDGPEEIASVCNLLLPLDDQFPIEKDFLREYMNLSENVYSMKEEKIEEFKEKLKGLVSFLRESYSTIKKEYIGEHNVGTLKHFVVDPIDMSRFQSKYYDLAVKSDRGGNTGVYTNSRESSLFVFPDGSYGREGFKKYVILKKTKMKIKRRKNAVLNEYIMSDELKNELIGDTHEEILNNISKFSITYSVVIRHILNTDGNCFVYSSIAQGSGGILFSLLLRLFGFVKASGNENTKRLRYGMLTYKTITTAGIKKIIDRFNRPDNMKGDYIKVIIGSKAISEGFSLNNVVFESINTPHWNYSETAQAIARGIRLGSHNDLLRAGENPVVKIIQPVAIPHESVESISTDLYMYETSEAKDISIKNILHTLMEVSFDCALNYYRNFFDGEDGSRECDYTFCRYKCDGIDMRDIEEGLDESEIDVSTFQLYYANPNITAIQEKIESMFRKNKNMSLQSIYSNLENDFTEEEISNALFMMKEKTEGDEVEYSTFIDVFSRSSVKKISNEIEKMFQKTFMITIDTIIEHFPENTLFEILDALRTLINKNVVITNKYGLQCYLREENNMFFLVTNLTVNSTIFSEYYSKYPHVKSNIDFSEIIANMYKNSLPDKIEEISKITDFNEFSVLMNSLPKSVQEIFIETGLSTIKDSKLKSMILTYFDKYINKIGDKWISSFLLEEENKLRCKNDDDTHDKWGDCEPEYYEKLKIHEQEKRQVVNDNPYGIRGLYNPVNDKFCLLDMLKEKKDISKIAKKRSTAVLDNRLTHSGKVCTAGGWKIEKLLDIVINRLKIDYPESFKEDVDREELIEQIKEEKVLQKVFAEEQVNEMTNDELRRALYWGLNKKKGGVRGIIPICDALKKWFESKNLLQIDDRCGVQGKKKVLNVNKKKKHHRYIVETIIPKKEKERFNSSYKQELKKLHTDCYGSSNWKPNVDNNEWTFVISRKKVIGAMLATDEGRVLEFIVGKNYQRKETVKIISDLLTGTLCRRTKPLLIVNNEDLNVKKLLKKYKKFGFVERRSDDKNTYMEYDC